MPISIYNTLTQKKEPFETIEPGKVRMYVCGVTVYDSCHIGHARSAVVFDVITRYLKARDYDVIYVRNFTDVDDKIIRRAAELKMDPKSLADKYIDEYYHDMDTLYVQRATFEPRVTEHIDDIIELIQTLIDKKIAYETEGNVFFAVDLFDGYGKLSNRRMEDMDPGARVEVDLRKINPFDFTLWKPAKPGEPFWESPWGKGRPGWHIECSAMSAKYLGQTFDIHGGGKDLIFPHHENEIAQSEAGHNKTFVRYWIHNGFVNINHQKMSKSLGNFEMVKDVIRVYHPEVVRLFLLSKQYRKPIDFNPENMEASRAALDRIYALLLRLNNTMGETIAKPEAQADVSMWNKFCHAMDDDFNTASALAEIFNVVRHANRIMDKYEEGGLTTEINEQLSCFKCTILQMGSVLGLCHDSPEDYFSSRRTTDHSQASIDMEQVQALIDQRESARQQKDWEKADQIRDQLAGMNIVLEDRPDGTIWKVEK